MFHQGRHAYSNSLAVGDAQLSAGCMGYVMNREHHSPHSKAHYRHIAGCQHLGARFQVFAFTGSDRQVLHD